MPVPLGDQLVVGICNQCGSVTDDVMTTATCSACETGWVGTVHTHGGEGAEARLNHEVKEIKDRIRPRRRSH